MHTLYGYINRRTALYIINMSMQILYMRETFMSKAVQSYTIKSY